VFIFRKIVILVYNYFHRCIDEKNKIVLYLYSIKFTKKKKLFWRRHPPEKKMEIPQSRVTVSRPRPLSTGEYRYRARPIGDCLRSNFALKFEELPKEKLEYLGVALDSDLGPVQVTHGGNPKPPVKSQNDNSVLFDVDGVPYEVWPDYSRLDAIDLTQTNTFTVQVLKDTFRYILPDTLTISEPRLSQNGIRFISDFGDVSFDQPDKPFIVQRAMVTVSLQADDKDLYDKEVLYPHSHYVNGICLGIQKYVDVMDHFIFQEFLDVTESAPASDFDVLWIDAGSAEDVKEKYFAQKISGPVCGHGHPMFLLNLEEAKWSKMVTCKQCHRETDFAIRTCKKRCEMTGICKVCDKGNRQLIEERIKEDSLRPNRKGIYSKRFPKGPHAPVCLPEDRCLYLRFRLNFASNKNITILEDGEEKEESLNDRYRSDPWVFDEQILIELSRLLNIFPQQLSVTDIFLADERDARLSHLMGTGLMGNGTKSTPLYRRGSCQPNLGGNPSSTARRASFATSPHRGSIACLTSPPSMDQSKFKSWTKRRGTFNDLSEIPTGGMNVPSYRRRSSLSPGPDPSPRRGSLRMEPEQPFSIEISIFHPLISLEFSRHNHRYEDYMKLDRRAMKEESLRRKKASDVQPSITSPTAKEGEDGTNQRRSLSRTGSGDSPRPSKIEDPLFYENLDESAGPTYSEVYVYPENAHRWPSRSTDLLDKFQIIHNILKSSTEYEKSPLEKEKQSYPLLRQVSSLAACNSPSGGVLFHNGRFPAGIPTSNPDMLLHTDPEEIEIESRVVVCTLCKNVNLEDKKLGLHKQYDCQQRIVSCELNCGESVVAKNLKKHMATQCKERGIRCPCGKVILAKDMEDHENECCLRTWECPACFEDMAIRAMVEHQTQSCTDRPVVCIWCHESMMHKNLSHHKIHQCTERITKAIELKRAVWIMDYDVVKSLLEEGADPNAYCSVVLEGPGGQCDSALGNCLHAAAAVDANKELVQLLLDYKADVNLRDQFGCQPLHLAGTYGARQCCDALIAGRADPLDEDADGRNALFNAAFYYRRHTIPLLEAGADPYLREAEMCKDRQRVDPAPRALIATDDTSVHHDIIYQRDLDEVLRITQYEHRIQPIRDSVTTLF